MYCELVVTLYLLRLCRSLPIAGCGERAEASQRQKDAGQDYEQAD